MAFESTGGLSPMMICITALLIIIDNVELSKVVIGEYILYVGGQKRKVRQITRI